MSFDSQSASDDDQSDDGSASPTPFDLAALGDALPPSVSPYALPSPHSSRERTLVGGGDASRVERRAVSARERQAAWDKAATIPGCNPALYRVDVPGSALYEHSYGRNTAMGWHVDHVRPLAQHGDYSPDNLQALAAAEPPQGRAVSVRLRGSGSTGR